MVEIPDTSAQYLEEFLKLHNINEIPEVARDTFNDFLSDRAAARSMYLALPEENFSQGLGQGDSPKQELIHQIEHSRLRVEGLNGIAIKSWEYSATYPEKHEELQNMNKTELVKFFDFTTDALFSFYSSGPLILEKIIQMPFNKILTGQAMIGKIAQHESLHVGMLVKFCDFANIPRTAAMKKAWG
jgi:hypothetical protein